MFIFFYIFPIFLLLLGGWKYLIPLFFLISCFFTIYFSNPVYSIIGLIFTYIFGALFAVAFGFTYLGLVYIIVYVGALTVLFLFVVMMLNLTVIEILGSKNSLFSRIKNFSFVYVFLFCFFILIFLFDNYIYFFYYLFDFFIANNSSKNSSVFLVSVDSFSLSHDFISNLGYVLYTKFFISFIVAAMLLLVSMIGAIVLTYSGKQRSLHSQVSFLQISRDYRKCIYICELE
jgi:NADH-ubiquinone oxidoreductase chain 6